VATSVLFITLTPLPDDDFADFQAAPSSSSASSTSSKPTLMEMLNSSPTRVAPATTKSVVVAPGKPPMALPSFGNTTNALGATATTNQAVITPVPVVPTPNNLWAASRPLSPSGPVRSTTSSVPNRASMSHASSPAPAASAKGLSGFEDLWSMSLGSGPAGKHTSTGKSIKDLEKEKAQAGIWASSQKPATRTPMGLSSAMGSNFRSFAPAKTGGASSSGGGDDLLL